MRALQASAAFLVALGALFAIIGGVRLAERPPVDSSHWWIATGACFAIAFILILAIVGHGFSSRRGTTLPADQAIGLAKLEVIWRNEAPYIGNQDYYRIGVKNHGPATAKNVAVTLERIDPDPLQDKDRILPSPIGEKGGYCQKAQMSCAIPSGREHYYDVFRGLHRGSVQNLFFGLQTVERLDIPFMLAEDQEYAFTLTASAENHSAPAYGRLLVVQGDDLHPVIRLDLRIETAQEIAQSRARQAIAALDQHIIEGHSILDSCGRPREQMVGADPMHFMNECIPRINKFGRDCTTTIDRHAPEFRGKFQNVGNITHGTDIKPAMVQQVERWLENLDAIQGELRTRL